jgi:hypothetical protein
MSLSFHLVEGAKIVEGLPPAADAAGRAGDYVSLKDASRIFVVAHITQGNAATVALTLFQATAVAGTGEKAITNACRSGRTSTPRPPIPWCRVPQRSATRPMPR